MKKIICLLAVLATTTFMSVPVYAHGGHGRGHRAVSAPDYEVCAVVDCAEAGLHDHDGVYYYCSNHDAGLNCWGGGCNPA